MRTEKEKLHENHFFTVKIAGMDVIGVEHNGYSITRPEEVSNKAEVKVIKLGVNNDNSDPIRIYWKEGIRKLLDAIEPDVQVEIIEHLVEDYRHHTTTTASPARFHGKFTPIPFGVPVSEREDDGEI